MGANQPASMMASNGTQAHAWCVCFTCNGIIQDNAPAPVPSTAASVPQAPRHPLPVIDGMESRTSRQSSCQELRIVLTTIALPEKFPEKTARKKDGKRAYFYTPFAVFGEIRPPGLSRMIESDPNLMPFLSIKQSKFGLIQANCR